MEAVTEERHCNLRVVLHGKHITEILYLHIHLEDLENMVPIAIVIGYWHRKTQWRVEQHALFKENVIGATMWLFVIDLIDGRVSEEEKQQMRDMLSKIVRKPPKPPAAEQTRN
jgi:hypothetical protein